LATAGAGLLAGERSRTRERDEIIRDSLKLRKCIEALKTGGEKGQLPNYSKVQVADVVALDFVDELQAHFDFIVCRNQRRRVRRPLPLDESTKEVI
jgi:hypothetical protein